MGLSRFRWYMAGLVAFLVGVPLTERAYGASLAGAIVDLVGVSIGTSRGDS